MDMETRVVERITDHSAIDTSPSYSPMEIYLFNSDRSGFNKYTMRSDGSQVKELLLVMVFMEHLFGLKR